MPPYDAGNDDHRRIATLAEQLSEQAGNLIAADAYLNDPNKVLTVRRRKLREQLAASAAFQEMERLGAAALGTTLVSEAGSEAGAEQDES